jgi:long-chain acyl-CoA synthetase
MNPSGSGEGEIAIRGPMVMRGYYNDPEETAKAIRDGWFLSGDLGHLDHENYLFITGRAKEVIVLSSGKNIYPEDVEKTYLKIPLVKEICVAAAEERGMVESLHGIIVPDLDYARKERIGNIREFLKTAINQVSMTMPPSMRLRGFTLSSEPLPRTPLGKVKRFMMKDFIEQARRGRRVTREEDTSLLQDETGRVIAECIASLQREKIPVHASDNLELDLRLDSLQRIELVVAIEKAFSLKLPETFASEIQTVEELLSRVKDEKSKGVRAAEGAAGEDIFSAEITEEEKREIGLVLSRTEWAVSALLLKVVRLILRIFFRLEIKGLDNLPEPPFIIASNHASNMDGFVVGGTVPLKVFRILFFQGFQVYFSGWWLPSLFGRLAHAIPIDPETFLSNALRLSSYVLRNRRILCIFPEGGRTFDGTIMPFKKGIGILALRHNIPVVPALIEGTFGALPRGAKWPKMTKVRISFGRLYHPSELDLSKRPGGVDEYQFFADEVRERVKALSSET